MSDGEAVPHVVVVDDIPTPYRLDLLRAVRAEGRVRVTVVWLSGWGRETHWRFDPDDWGVPQYTLPSKQVYLPGRDRRIQLSWGVGALLDRLAPDVLVLGNYVHWGDWSALFYARRRRIPAVAWSGSTLVSERHRDPLTRALKRAFLGRCVRTFAYGRWAADFVRVLGVPSERIDVVTNTSDLSAFRRAATRRPPVPEGTPLRLVSACRLIRAKGLHLLARILADLDADVDWQWRICGDGPFRAELEKLVDDLGLGGRVRFEGFVQGADLAAHLARADVMVFPTLRDVWGLVVNEALAVGCYVLCSDRAGAGADLLDGVLSGERIDPEDADAFGLALKGIWARLAEIRARGDERSRAAMAVDVTVVAKAFIDGAIRAWRDR